VLLHNKSLAFEWDEQKHVLSVNAAWRKNSIGQVTVKFAH
jgi:hypothetical protein